MNENLEHKINVVVGIYVLSCLAASFYYGWYSIIVCAVGLFVMALLLQVLRGGTGGR